MRPVFVSIAGVFHTEPPSCFFGTMKVFQRRFPVRASSATTEPRTFTSGSPVSPKSAEIPM